MSEEVTNNPDYPQHHPNAIQDIGKAHEVAQAGKRLRDYAARDRRVSEFAMEFASQEGNYGDNVAEAFEKSLQAPPADSIETRQRERALSTLIQSGNDSERVISELNRRASGNDETADWYEERAAAQYDAQAANKAAGKAIVANTVEIDVQSIETPAEPIEVHVDGKS